MIKTDAPYKVKKFDMSSLSRSEGNPGYCVSGPGIASDFTGTFPRTLKGMLYGDAQDLANMLNSAYKYGQLERSREVRIMFQNLVGLD